MRLHLLCVSRRPTGWVQDACEEYLKRLRGKLDVRVRDLSPVTRPGNPAEQQAREGEVLLGAMPAHALLIALDERGSPWSTREFARLLDQWRQGARDVAMMIGGAAGLDDRVRGAAAHLWSLSPLTLPHQLARVLVVEQLYRACSLLENHPYHRE